MNKYSYIFLTKGQSPNITGTLEATDIHLAFAIMRIKYPHGGLCVTIIDEG